MLAGGHTPVFCISEIPEAVSFHFVHIVLPLTRHHLYTISYICQTLDYFLQRMEKYVEDKRSWMWVSMTGDEIAFITSKDISAITLSLVELREPPEPLPLPSSVRPSSKSMTGSLPISRILMMGTPGSYSSSWTLEQLRITPALLCAANLMRLRPGPRPDNFNRVLITMG